MTTSTMRDHGGLSIGKVPMQGEVSLRWLIGISLVCLVLVFGVRWFFAGLEDKLREHGTNERARLFVGEEIVRGIQGVEKDVYLMAATQNAAGFARVYKAVDARLDKLMNDLNVLKFGGTARRQMPLNIGGQGEFAREAIYRPDAQNQGLVMELIEIGPQLGQIRDRVDELERRLTLRWQTVERDDHKRFFLVEEEIAVLFKQLPPYFERLGENANRLFLDGDERQRALEAELRSQRNNLNLVETLLIALVVALGGGAGTLLLRRLTAALEEARMAGKEIERQRKQHATILDTLSDGVYATDMDGRIVFINAAAERILGWRTQELEGLQAHQTIHHTRPNGDSYPREQCPLLAVLLEGSSLEGEEHFVGRDGRFIPVSYRSKPLLLGDETAGSLVTFQDISERYESKARIRRQQAALDAAANMIVISGRNSVIEYVNPAFCKTTGYTADEVIGKKTSILSSGIHDAAFYRAMWDTLLEGKPWEGELINRRKDGSLYPEQMTITPIFEQGAITHYVAIKRDITEEAKIKTHLKLVETAIQETEQGVLITDADPDDQGPTIQYVNSGFSRITGYSSEDAVGRYTGILRGPETVPEKAVQLREALAAGNSITLEMNYRRKDGSPFIAEVHFSPVRNEQGKVGHYIGLLSDIGPRKEIEEALRKAHDQALENVRLKSEFLSTMSHEIRTPMNGIIGMTDLLLDTPLNPEQRDFTGIVRDSAHSLLTIINDILDFSKIEAGKLEIEITDFSPVYVVESAVELLAAKAREKELSLMSFVDPSLPSRLRGDPTRLRQVLLNLIGNAVKFTPRGGIELNALHERDGDNPRVRFEIRDTGIGISADTQARLFQSFTQADSSTTRKYGGTGLGLAIGKRLVELMGGEIGVVSEEGKGSTFWFTLPLIVSAESVQAVPAHRPRTQDTQDLRVLVVDDRPSDREILHRYLTSWGLINDDASNAGEALKLMQNAADIGKHYDIALIDFAMPGMDGIELARAIRSERKFDGTRLVLLTAYDQRNLFAQARTAGFAACLAKPVRQSQLFDSLADSPAEVTEVGGSDLVAEELPPVPNLRGAMENRRLILLAEDNPTNQKVAQLQINKLGYAVHIVGNGQEAAEAAEALPYAAILMDCQMPVMDGFEATAAIRKVERSGTKRVPIIAMTANAMQGDRERCIVAGMDDYISKPINLDRLGSVLAKWAGSPADGAAPVVSPALSSSQPIDFERLKDFCGDDPHVLAELLEVFRASTVILMDKLYSAGLHDAAAVKALAHEAKGSCGNLGIENMARIAADLADATDDADWPRVGALCGDLDNAFKQVESAIEKQRQESSN